MTQKHFPAERSTYTDPDTGASVTQWTNAPCTNQHLYFTSLSVTGDDRWLTIISDRGGNPNLYALDRRDGTIRRLSNNESGLLRSYVYPQGGLQGFSKVSPCLDPCHNRIFYIQNDMVYSVDLDNPDALDRKVCDLPTGWYGAYTHVSPDGKTFCVPCTDPRAFADEKTQWEQLGKVPLRMKKEGLVTRIYLIDIATGKMRVTAEVPFWVTHVQFDPAGTGRIVFNLEGHIDGEGSPLPNRIWCLETNGAFRPISAEPANEWRSHENWAPDGQSIVYHGVRDGKSFVAARTWEGELLHETSIEGIEFWHATGALDGRRKFVDRRDGMVSILDPGATENRLTDLCRHDTSYDIQDAHAHPLTTPSGKSVIFTSNRTGNCQVYEVSLPALTAPPTIKTPLQNDSMVPAA
jgi:Tol biopolymer transport system component